MRRNEIASIQEPHCRLGRFVLPRFWTRFVRMTAVPRLRLPSLAWTVSSQFSAATGSMYWRIRVLNRALVSQASRSEEHTSELQSLMRISYAVFCLKKKKQQQAQQ